MAATGFHSADELNALLPGTLPGLLGIVIDTHERGRLTSHLDVRPELLAPNGYLHAGTVVTLADTSCGLPTRALLPESLDWLRLSGLVVGDGVVDLLLERHPRDVGVTVLRREGDIEIVSVK